jgi:hypothetical protein
MQTSRRELDLALAKVCLSVVAATPLLCKWRPCPCGCSACNNLYSAYHVSRVLELVCQVALLRLHSSQRQQGQHGWERHNKQGHQALSCRQTKQQSLADQCREIAVSDLTMYVLHATINLSASQEDRHEHGAT